MENVGKSCAIMLRMAERAVAGLKSAKAAEGATDETGIRIRRGAMPKKRSDAQKDLKYPWR